MPKYKEGDKVKVLDDLEVRSGYYMDDGSHHNSVVPEMTHLRGQVVTIEEVDCYGYHIREDGGGWGWTDEIFAGFAVKYHVGDTGTGRPRSYDHWGGCGGRVRERTRLLHR